MSKRSAGLLMFRRRAGQLEVLLAHPGGPLWASKDRGVWSIPKGELEPGDEPLAAAIREFKEETGFDPHGPFIPLGRITQKSGKVVEAWAFEGDCDPALARSNTFALEWPPKSGRLQEFPEVDRVAFFPVDAALERIKPAQAPLIARLRDAL